MLSYSLFGVSDRAARIPAAVDAALLIAAIYLFLRRFRPGSEIDGALITAGCVGIIGFARGASTDMPLAATLAIAMLAWFAWYEGKNRLALAAFYFFLALAASAKGPVALFLAVAVVLIFAAIKREWRSILDTLWIPGIALFLAVMLPWYVLVQLHNPEFFRVFILEHNFGRFGHDLYHHRQPFWFYIPVLLVALMPWTLWLILAMVERARLIWSEKREAWTTPEDSWQLFLLIWLLIPVLFFSASQSKLPGYILPATPAGALLVSEYIRGRRGADATTPKWIAATHGALCGLLVFAAMSAPVLQISHGLSAGRWTYIACGAGVIAMLAIAVSLARMGLRILRPATMAAVVISVAAILRLASPTIDAAQSARPIAQNILSFSHEAVPVALYHVTRQQEYGLEFYLDRPTARYENGEVPNEAHVLVAVQNSLPQFRELVRERRVSFLTSIPAQKLELYWVEKGNAVSD